MDNLLVSIVKDVPLVVVAMPNRQMKMSRTITIRWSTLHYLLTINVGQLNLLEKLIVLVELHLLSNFTKRVVDLNIIIMLLSGGGVK